MGRFIHGWQPDLPDKRDLLYTLSRGPLVTAPPEMVHLEVDKAMPPVYDQGQLGSCTANAIAAAMQFTRQKQTTQPAAMPSRLFIYYNERVMENTVRQDAGAQIRDGVKSVATQGVCAETEWPYNIDEFDAKPPAPCYSDATKFEALQYLRLDNTNQEQLITCLAAGFPFVFGFSVYSEFESDAVAKSGKLTMPKKGSKLLGGHAVLCVGYILSKKVFIVRNSWGDGWGKKGYFTMPFEYMTDSNLADDFWTIRMVE